jgi:hypothetical protein
VEFGELGRLVHHLRCSIADDDELKNDRILGLGVAQKFLFLNSLDV